MRISLPRFGHKLAGLRAMLLLVAVAGLFGIGTDHGSTVTATEDDSGGSLVYNVLNATRFRASYGLESDLPYVEQSVSDPNTFPNVGYGVPLTDAEANDLDARQQRALLTNEALEYAVSQNDYAGMFFDQRNGGVPVFRFTTREDDHAAAIEARLPSDLPFSVTLAENTLADLETTYSQILADRSRLLESMPMATVDVDVVTNSVVVGLAMETPDALAELRASYGASVDVEVAGRLAEDTCSNRNNCGGTTGEPWKGGLKIFLSGDQGFWCTSGILARRGSNLVMVTAGHCLVNSPADFGDIWKHNTTTPHNIGDALGGTIGDADGSPGDGCLCHTDVGWIDVDTWAGTTPLDSFYGVGPTYIWEVSDTPDDWNPLQQVGSSICRGGAASDYVCGQIDKLIAARTDLDGHDVDGMRRTDFDATPGDSGAPMFSGHHFLGIHNDSLDGVFPPDPGHSWYTTSDGIEGAGNLICMTSSC